MNWIKVEDGLPETHEYGGPDLIVSDRVLCHTSSGRTAVGYLMNGEWQEDARSATFREWGYEITHWTYIEEPEAT